MIIFVPGNVPSLKNSKVVTKKGVFPSKTVMNYLRSIGIQGFSSRKKEVKEYVDKTKPNLFKQAFHDFEKPDKIIRVGFHFVRNTKAKFDYINAMQLPLDLMTAHDFIEDDDCDHVIPYVLELGGKPYSVAKENPGVWIKIT